MSSTLFRKGLEGTVGLVPVLLPTVVGPPVGVTLPPPRQGQVAAEARPTPRTLAGRDHGARLGVEPLQPCGAARAAQRIMLGGPLATGAPDDVHGSLPCVLSPAPGV